jgi:DNA-directed RNA polymerase subunit RPC12/RpoP
VVETGYLAAPRGTTEYDTDHHRCPACGSTDVNWAGDDVLCLRCSAVAEEQ